MTPEENYADITVMQTEWHSSWRDKERIIIVMEPDGTYTIHQHTKESVYCPTPKKTTREVASRLLQLLNVGPIAPQDWPEEICVGTIDYKSADILPLTKETTKVTSPEEIAAWVKSDEGQHSLRQAREDVRKIVEESGFARKIEPSLLRDPTTI